MLIDCTGMERIPTSLSSDADDFVGALGDTFEDDMAHWVEAIQRHIVKGVPLTGEYGL